MPKNSMKYFWIYIPIIWFSGSIVILQFMAFWRDYAWIPPLFYLLLGLVIFADYMIFAFSALFFTKLTLILVNLIHIPKEGVFHVTKDKRDYTFWCLRKMLKKFTIWIMRNTPIPWIDTVAFRWFGVKVDFSNSIQDSWVDMEFIETGKRVFMGQGSAVMSSCVVGNYLIIKKVILEDYVVVGGEAVVSPGTIMRENSILGAVSVSHFNQELEKDWVYMGVPARKYKPNKYSGKDAIIRRKIDEGEFSKEKLED